MSSNMNQQDLLDYIQKQNDYIKTLEKINKEMKKNEPTVRRTYPTKCKKSCRSCKKIKKSASVTSYLTDENFEINTSLTCRSKFVVYLLSCRGCDWRYVGSSWQPMFKRVWGHTREIKKKSGALGDHFHHDGPCKEAGYTMVLLDQLERNFRRKELLALEGFYERLLPECRVELGGGNKRSEGKDVNGKYRKE